MDCPDRFGGEKITSPLGLLPWFSIRLAGSGYPETFKKPLLSPRDFN